MKITELAEMPEMPEIPETRLMLQHRWGHHNTGLPRPNYFIAVIFLP